MSKIENLVREGIEAQKAEIWKAQYVREIKARLAERAESYSGDARKFHDAGALGRPVMSAEDDARFALVYRTIADELRRVAADLDGS